jgi:hypothetical protein
VDRWADTAGCVVRLAIVACPVHIDRARFGLTVAFNRGLVANIFDTEADAAAWLDTLPGDNPAASMPPAGSTRAS